MLKGSCHCGKVKWTIKKTPDSATACNCSVCRRYGVLWAYDFENEGMSVSGSAKKYIRGQSIGFYFCPSITLTDSFHSRTCQEMGNVFQIIGFNHDLMPTRIKKARHLQENAS